MTLLKVIKEDKDIRSIFGKREIEIIDKQLNGIKLMPSEQTRLSRDIRRKFEAIRKLAAYSEEFKLKKGKIIKELIENAKEIILKSKYLPKISKIILFGSAVKNELNYRSDIDIAVVFSEISKGEAEEFRVKLLGRLPSKIDLQVYNILPDKIKKEIDNEGKILWKKE